jgi:single stranded DNA-binding protein
MKLSVELIPKTCRYKNLRNMLSKKSWESIKKITFHRAENRCEVCGKQGRKWPVECHEIWDYDDDRKIQTLKGFAALCPKCHRVTHAGFVSVKSRYGIIIRHLADVNQWTTGKAKHYLVSRFELWEQRSKHQWTQDLTILNNYKPSVSQKENHIMNVTVLTGNLGNDPESIFTEEGLHIVKFSLAFRFGRKKTGWIRVSCFNKTAELAEKYLHKGAKIGVSGTLQQEKWESNGEKKSEIKLNANTIEFIKTDGRGFENGDEGDNDYE